MHFRFSKIWYGVLLVVLILGGSFWRASSLEDFELHWTRSIPYTHEKNPGASLDDYLKWEDFVRSLKSIRYVENPDVIPKEPHVGDRIQLSIVPTKKEWKRFQIEIEILEYVPGERLMVKLLRSSPGKTEKLLQDVIWGIKIADGKVRGSAHAKTRGFKSRWFGLYASKIVMNQIYPFDLINFAEKTRPE